MHWKNAKDKWLKEGITKHAGITRPTNDELKYQIGEYGYCMPWPPPTFPPMLGQVMRPDFVNQWIDGKQYTDLRFFWGLGYVNEQGKLIPEYGNGVAGYFMFMADSPFREFQQQWLDKQPKWKRIQWARCNDTYISAVDYQIKASRRKMIVSQRLLGVQEYKELDAAKNLELEDTPWRKESKE